MGYIYAVLHSPNYREKYLEFLKIDFPRIPFVDDEKTFENYWLPLLEKEHKWMFSKGLDHISTSDIRDEAKHFKTLKKRDDSDFFNIFLKMPNNRKEYKNV